MVNRLVSVGDDFKLPAAVKVENANLPAPLQPAALNATILEQVAAPISAAAAPKLDSATAATTYAAKSTQTTVETGRLSDATVTTKIQTESASYLASNPGVVDAANTAVTNKVNGLSLITYGTAIGAAHLDTLTTPGQYTQGTTGNVTTVNGYPFAGEPCLVEVLSMGGETRLQRVTPVWGASQGHVIWQRVRVNVATGWETTWNAIAAQKIDTALGKFEVWDDVRKRFQLSPTSDTGWRNISSTLENGWTASEILIRRFGYRVSLLMRNVQAGTAATIITLPTGFAPRSGGVILSSLTDSPSWTLRVTVADTGVVSVPTTSTVPDIRQEWSWSTLQAWPATLPGTASGTIPNA